LVFSDSCVVILCVGKLPIHSVRIRSLNCEWIFEDLLCKLILTDLFFFFFMINLLLFYVLVLIPLLALQDQRFIPLLFWFTYFLWFSIFLIFFLHKSIYFLSFYIYALFL
jgi:hypothetical protein